MVTDGKRAIHDHKGSNILFQFLPGEFILPVVTHGVSEGAGATNSQGAVIFQPPHKRISAGAVAVGDPGSLCFGGQHQDTTNSQQERQCKESQFFHKITNFFL